MRKWRTEQARVKHNLTIMLISVVFIDYPGESPSGDSPATVDRGVASAASGNDGIAPIHYTLVSDAERPESIQIIACPRIVRLLR